MKGHPESSSAVLRLYLCQEKRAKKEVNTFGFVESGYGFKSNIEAKREQKAAIYEAAQYLCADPSIGHFITHWSLGSLDRSQKMQNLAHWQRKRITHMGLRYLNCPKGNIEGNHVSKIVESADEPCR